MTASSKLTLEDAAQFLGWSIPHLRRLIKTGDLRPGNDPGTVLWADVRLLAQRSHRLPQFAGDAHTEAAEPPAFLLDGRAQRSSLADFPLNRVVQGNVLDTLTTMPEASVQCVVTSPPYWGVRRYADNQEASWLDGSTVAFGQEKWPEDYVRHSLEILRLLRTVVKQDGVVWWNIGDTYMTRSHVRADSGERLDALEGRRAGESWKDYPVRRYSAGHPYLKDKDLTLVPFQIALGAQRLGWWVRSIIVWSKENTLPEPVKDRPTTSHEYILMLTQTRFYKYNTSAAVEDAVSDWSNNESPLRKRNARTVWTFPTSSGGYSHVAAFPIELPLRCIKASSDPADLVFDPFAGSGTTLVAAKRLGRDYYGLDISPTYVAEANSRLAAEATPPPSSEAVVPRSEEPQLVSSAALA